MEEAPGPSSEAEEGELPQEAEEPGSQPAGGMPVGALVPPLERRPQPGFAQLNSEFSAEVKAAAARIAKTLREKKLHLLRRLCQRFGVPAALEVLRDTLAAEAGGGVARADGARREPGGTFLKLFAARVPRAQLKEVLAAAAADLRLATGLSPAAKKKVKKSRAREGRSDAETTPPDRLEP